MLIRDVSPDDLERIRAAAAARGTSLQAYLKEALHSQASYLRRRKRWPGLPNGCGLGPMCPRPSGERCWIPSTPYTLSGLKTWPTA